MLSTEVVVVGGGPAGAAAAITLVRAGLDVVLIDKALVPRDKCCGDGLTTGALRLLEGLGLRPDAVPSWRPVDAAWVRSPSGRVVGFDLPAGRGLYAAIAPRFELDAALLDVARAAGVQVRDGHALGEVSAGSDDVTVEAIGLGPIRARYAVGADGMWSPLRKRLGVSDPGYLGEWHAFRQYVSDVTGSAAERLWVWFDEELLPGYAWSFPLPGGRANVGFGIRRDGHRRIQEMKELWPALLARPHIADALGPRARLEDGHRAWPIPARIDSVRLAVGRVLFVGDAAAATDVLTGEGIGQALLTGILAAEAIVAAGPAQPNLARSRYAAGVRRELVPDHRMSALLSAVLRSPLGARGAVRLAGATPWTRASFARWLFEDEPRAVTLTPGRWHRGFLARDGAYAPG